MTLSLPRISRFAGLSLALVYTAVSFGVATSSAPLSAQSGPYYTATLAQPAEDNRAVAGGVAWNCAGTTCVANKGTSRPSRVCRGLAREFGEIVSFTADGEALAEDKLSRCNGN
ncbi:CC_3452 family protein [Erythrobacter sp. Alg231-14]|uniref:CC_3452 family protein n=1 Tax=Erythrobacter sp. Alg231-14 TaxID=1922225 RepID=UPI000D54F64E